MKPNAWDSRRAESFKDLDTVAAYEYRAPYPEEAFLILTELITDSPRSVLDAGCGRGEIARGMVNHADRVDAVDFSRPMIEAGYKLVDGNHPRLNWIHGRIENTPLNPPYSLITAGHSLHWFDWDVVMPRFSQMLTPNGYLAIAGNVFADFPWTGELRKLRVKYRGYETTRPHTVVAELHKRGFFEVAGNRETSEVIHSTSMDAYIEQYHSRSDMARVQLGRKAADRFDAELREILSGYVKGDIIEVKYHMRVTWGKPGA